MREFILKSIEAHGGLARWEQVASISAKFQPDGLALKLRGQEAFSKQPTRVTVSTREQRVGFDPFIQPGRRGLYQPERTALLDASGATLEELKNPRSSFRPDGGWSELQLLYFAGHALWTYFNLPYILIRDDIRLEELQPWQEGSESWRAIKVTFPKSIATLSSEQVLYFDAKGLIRREDYAVEISGTERVAHYVDGHQEFGGLVFPTKRRIYPCGPDNKPLTNIVIMAAELSDYTVSGPYIGGCA